MVLACEQREREALRQHAAEALAGLYTGEAVASPYVGGRAEGLRLLEAFDAVRYNAQRHLATPEGTSRLSPYIRHGLLSLTEVRDSVVSRFGAREARRFVHQILWRVFWHLVYPERNPHEEPAVVPLRRPGPSPAEPTGLYCIDESVRELRATGFLHFRARLWVASCLLHFRGVRWQNGACFFQEHLLDADPAVNTLWWRWVLGDLTGQPYLFNRAQVIEQTEGQYCARCPAYQCPFDGTLEAVAARARKAGVTSR